jgi:hypothetical protein
MPRWKHSTSERFHRARRGASREDGSAALEFVTAGLILLVPLVYLVLTLAAVQAGALAVEGAARQAARVFVQSSPEEAASRAARAIDFGLADYGIASDAASVTVSCSGSSSASCPSRNAVVTVTVAVDVALPLVPDVLDLSRTASVTVQATARQQVSRFLAEG